MTVSPEAYALDEMRLIFSGEPQHPMNTRPHIRFVVYGLPQPRGSKNAFVNRKTGKAIVTDDNPRSREWMNLVRDKAVLAMADQPLLDGPLKLGITFYLPRPKGHYGTGRNANIVRPSAPLFPASRPDATKLLRGVEDALTGTVYHDDGQVVIQMVMKRYAERPRAEIVVGCL